MKGELHQLVLAEQKGHKRACSPSVGRNYRPLAQELLRGGRGAPRSEVRQRQVAPLGATDLVQRSQRATASPAGAARPFFPDTGGCDDWSEGPSVTKVDFSQ
jgi:hypothetical protein